LTLYRVPALWNLSRVRFLIVALISMLFCAAASAQEQERKLIDRVLKPNTELQGSEQNKAFSGGKAFDRAGSLQVKNFEFVEKVRPKDYNAGTFTGAKSWAGNFSFAARAANTKAGAIPSVTDKIYETKPVVVKESPEAGKTVATRETQTGEFLIQGKSQRLFDYENANRRTMSIDEVRTLLNKNK
jgi:hypothetical protein